MGKKSKRRSPAGTAASTASTGLPTRTRIACKPEELVFVPKPPSFAGIISTNVNPAQCAMPSCTNEVFLGAVSPGKVTGCCGKRVCSSCFVVKDGVYTQRSIYFDMKGVPRCVFCRKKPNEMQALLERAVKDEKPWALPLLGTVGGPEGHVTNDKRRHYLTIAAARGHPEAILELAKIYTYGRGEFPQDLALAEMLARKAKTFHPALAVGSNRVLLHVAIAETNRGEVEASHAILHGLTNEPIGSIDQMTCLASTTAFQRAKLDRSAGNMSVRSFCTGHVEAALDAALHYCYSGNYALSKLWLNVACLAKPICKFSLETKIKKKEVNWSDWHADLTYIRSTLRKLRDRCGGCGFRLDGDSRKVCRRCHTYCYCNEECQALHWKNGHSNTCKEVELHLQTAQHAIRNNGISGTFPLALVAVADAGEIQQDASDGRSWACSICKRVSFNTFEETKKHEAGCNMCVGLFEHSRGNDPVAGKASGAESLLSALRNACAELSPLGAPQCIGSENATTCQGVHELPDDLDDLSL